MYIQLYQLFYYLSLVSILLSPAYIIHYFGVYTRFGINSTLQTIIFHNLTLIRKIIKFISQNTLIIAKKTSILRNILSNLYKILRFFFKIFIMTMLSYLSILFLIQIYDVMYQ